MEVVLSCRDFPLVLETISHRYETRVCVGSWLVLEVLDRPVYPAYHRRLNAGVYFTTDQANQARYPEQ